MYIYIYIHVYTHIVYIYILCLLLHIAFIHCMRSPLTLNTSTGQQTAATGCRLWTSLSILPRPKSVSRNRNSSEMVFPRLTVDQSGAERTHRRGNYHTHGTCSPLVTSTRQLVALLSLRRQQLPDVVWDRPSLRIRPSLANLLG